nr:SET domain-containing protein [Candidatus Sigynarchaeota archaeon]
MMLVDTYVAASPIEGLGVFAAVDIPKGARIWQFDQGFDIVLYKQQLGRMAPWQASFFKRYCFMFKGRYYYCVDNARFMNHSSSSNTYETDDATCAAMDIKAGEEITCDYGDMGVTPEDKAENLWPFVDTGDEKQKVT